MNKVGLRGISLGLIAISLIIVAVVAQVRAEEEYHVIATLQSPEPSTGAQFGFSLAFRDGILVVGDPFANIEGCSSAGRAFVYDSEGNLKATLQAPEPKTSGKLGWSVAVSGDIVAIGEVTGASWSRPTAGEAYVFNSDGSLLTTLHSPTPEEDKKFGANVAVDGDIIVVSDHYFKIEEKMRAGRAYVFDTEGSLLATLQSPTPGSRTYFSKSVTVGGDTIVIGEIVVAAGSQPVGPSNAYIFDLDANLKATLQAPEPYPSINFGGTVAVSGDVVVVGDSYAEVDGKVQAGRVYIFDSDGNHLTTLQAPEPEERAEFGASVAISGDTLVIGEYKADVETMNEGRAYLFDTDGNHLTTLQAPELGTGAYFGRSVAICGDTVVVAARNAEVEGMSQAGKVYIFNPGAEAESEPKAEPVSEPEQEQPEAPKTKGIPGFPFESIILGLAVGAIVIWLLQRRR